MNGFSVWIGIGASLGLWRVARSAPEKQAGALVDSGLLVLFASLLGARISYALVNWPYYSSHPIEIPQVWLGGLTWPGAVGGAWISLLYLALTYRDLHGARVSPGWIADRLYPLLPPLSITAWLGCWMIGAANGPALPAGMWWGIPSPNETGITSLRWPLQPLAAASLLLFFWFLEATIKPKQASGSLSGRATVGLLVHLLLTSLICADPSPLWNGQRIDVWIAAFFLVVFCVFVISISIFAWLRKGHWLSNVRAFFYLKHNPLIKPTHNKIGDERS